MKIPWFVLLATLLVCQVVCQVPLSAKEPLAIPAVRTVGSIYGKAVTTTDIGLTAPIDVAVKFDVRDRERWELMGRIMTTFGKPVLDRFVKEQKIDATDLEIAQFKKNWRLQRVKHFNETEDRLKQLQFDLASPDLTDKKRGELEKQKATLDTIFPHLRDSTKRDVPEAFARMILVTRKTESELHKRYGGDVIFQQAGPEALDARRLLFEEAEKKNDLKFDDAGVRHLFYYYYLKMNHSVIDEKVLKKMWAAGGGN